ncbi:type II toxin-antitoxin system mRNA interferase toxin, RelE/StbE family [Patescibacteria group bacterium]|nr:type II toxin-antitoxin system mRNA interferase toxin, RelE/StbE family [Patescibacteria group bacterium]
MKVKFQKSFTGQFKRLSETKKQLATDTIELFTADPMNDSLRNHPLKDKWVNYRSITANDDLRLHYRVIDKDTALFVAVDTHYELYR